jgi:hypothetical protein
MSPEYLATVLSSIGVSAQYTVVIVIASSASTSSPRKVMLWI